VHELPEEPIPDRKGGRLGQRRFPLAVRQYWRGEPVGANGVVAVPKEG
jgi:hypothetical protein